MRFLELIYEHWVLSILFIVFLDVFVCDVISALKNRETNDKNEEENDEEDYS